MTTDSPSNGGGRRGVIDKVGAELRALRREVAETSAITRGSAGLLAEVMPRLDDLEQRVASAQGALDVLTEAREEQDEAVAADQAARQAIGMANTPPGPWAWPVLDQETATAAWDALARWVGELCAWYGPTRGELPDCWPLHRRAVLELTWLRQAHVEAHQPAAPAHLAADWHARWRSTALAGVAEAIDPQACAPGVHLAGPEQRASQRELERARAEPATPSHWHPHLRLAAEADIATRRWSRNSSEA